MDALECIMTRRSVRRYTDADVTKEQIETLLRAGMQAPTAVNNRDWAFVVVRDKQVKVEIEASLDGNGHMLLEAPVAIVVCGDMDLTIKSDPDYWIQDCSAATENILLAAHTLGLGAVWLGTYPVMRRVEKVAKILNLPKTIIPLAVISIGHPASKTTPADRYEERKIHYDQW